MLSAEQVGLSWHWASTNISTQRGRWRTNLHEGGNEIKKNRGGYRVRTGGWYILSWLNTRLILPSIVWSKSRLLIVAVYVLLGWTSEARIWFHHLLLRQHTDDLTYITDSRTHTHILPSHWATLEKCLLGFSCVCNLLNHRGLETWSWISLGYNLWCTAAFPRVENRQSSLFFQIGTLIKMPEQCLVSTLISECVLKGLLCFWIWLVCWNIHPCLLQRRTPCSGQFS